MVLYFKCSRQIGSAMHKGYIESVFNPLMALTGEAVLAILDVKVNI